MCSGKSVAEPGISSTDSKRSISDSYKTRRTDDKFTTGRRRPDSKAARKPNN